MRKTVNELTKEDGELLVWALKTDMRFVPLTEADSNPIVTAVYVDVKNPNEVAVLFTVELQTEKYDKFLTLRLKVWQQDWYELFIDPYQIQVIDRIVIDWAIRVGLIERLNWPGSDSSVEVCPYCGSLDTTDEEGVDRYCSNCSKLYVTF